MTETDSEQSLPARRVAAWEWTQVVLLAVNLMWTTLCLGGFRPETMVVTSALNGLLLAVHGLGVALLRPGRAHPAGWWLLPFLGYAAANVFWVSPVPWVGWRDWIGWAQMVAVFWVVLNGVRSSRAKAALFWWLVTVGAVAIVLGCYQRFVRPEWLMMGRAQVSSFIGRMSGPFGVPNSLAALLILLFPPIAAGVFRRGASAVQRVLCGYLALVFLLGIVLTISRGAWLGLGLVLVLWPLVGWRVSWLKRLLATAAVGVALVGLIGILYKTVPNVRERLQTMAADRGERSRPILWRGAWRIFADQPIWGSGAGSYNWAFEKHRPEHFQDEPLWAHNDYLNTLSDYGAAGFGLFFGGCGMVVWRCVRRRRKRKASVDAGDGAMELGPGNVAAFARRNRWREESSRLQSLAAGIAAFGLHLFVDFHLKSPALAMALATLAALAVQEAWPVETEPAGAPASVRGWRWGAVVFAVAAIVGTVFGAVPLYRAEALRYAARQAIDGLALKGVAPSAWAPILGSAAERLERATQIDPRNGAAWADLSYVSALRAEVEPQRRQEWGTEAERQAARALDCSSFIPEFWVRRGMALDLQGRRVEGGAAFVEALKRAPASALMWYYQAFHLSLDPNDPGRALAAVGFCLRLDPGNSEAQALQRRLAARSRAP